MEWKVIDAFPDYSVSEDGRVRNDRTGRVLRPRKVRGDLGQVCLGGRYLYVHRLTQQAFFGREYVLPEITPAPVAVFRPGTNWLPDWHDGVIIVEDSVGYARQSGFAQAVRRALGPTWKVWSRKGTLYVERRNNNVSH